MRPQMSALARKRLEDKKDAQTLREIAVRHGFSASLPDEVLLGALRNAPCWNNWPDTPALEERYAKALDLPATVHGYARRCQEIQAAEARRG